MKLHANAKLTIKQREEVKRLHKEKGISYRNLAKRFGVSVFTIARWIRRDCPLDMSSAPKNPRRTLMQQQKEVIRQYRTENPKAGARTIAAVLSREYGPMSHATVSRFLKESGLTKPYEKRRWDRKPLNVGRHRLQMDIHTLPAIEGGAGFEYQITIIHMATRMKYSEIHPQVTSETVSQVVRNALAHMPPFF